MAPNAFYFVDCRNDSYVTKQMVEDWIQSGYEISWAADVMASLRWRHDAIYERMKIANFIYRRYILNGEHAD